MNQRLLPGSDFGEVRSERDVDHVFDRFVERVDHLLLAVTAEELLKDFAPCGGGLSFFRDDRGGLIGFTIRRLIADSTRILRNVGDCEAAVEALADRLVDHYGFPADWVPPRVLVREALALTVRRREIVERLESGIGTPISTSMLDRASEGVPTAEEAFLLDDEQADAILSRIPLSEG